MSAWPLLLPMLILLVCCSTAAAAEPARPAKVEIPAGFPEFHVPGREPQMRSLQQLFALHALGAGPGATLWDQWIASAALWPASIDPTAPDSYRERWARALSSRRLDDDGYIATHQHAGLGHTDGWPFPLWSQGGGVGWHFSMLGMPYGQESGIRAVKPDGFAVTGMADQGVVEEGWSLKLTDAHATLTTPTFAITPDNGSFLKIAWTVRGLKDAKITVEWTAQESQEFHPADSMAVPVPQQDGYVETMGPLHSSPQWKAPIRRFRLRVENAAGGQMVIRYLATAFDTRHNVNNASYIIGCCDYANWTGDLEFLRRNIGKIRRAARFIVDELGTRQNLCVVTPWPGHDGRTGLAKNSDGSKRLLHGRGIGNNYWDLLPFGGQDALATIYAYDALRRLAELESQIAANPDWQIPADSAALNATFMREHAQQIKDSAGQKFWNDQTGRFVACIDSDGQPHDFGFTFVNLEAIATGFATPQQARSILDWLDGKRTVTGDTSTGPDIYHWRFAPRSSTRRNVEWYGWYWSAPESIPYGYQVQDGGAVLGFSYHDLTARLMTHGPDDASQRLFAILKWFDEVQAEGGYRAYYRDRKRGTLQGGGPPGGLGLDHEFVESVLVPQVMLYGFLGARPRMDGIELNPRLPQDWPQLRVTQVRLHGLTLDITAATDRIVIRGSGESDRPLRLYVPADQWQAQGGSLPLPGGGGELVVLRGEHRQ